MKRIVSFFLVLCLFTGLSATRAESAQADNRIEYQQLLNTYADSIVFINNNTDRSLIPLVFSSGETENELRVYRIYGDVLSATVKTKGTSRGVVWFQITLTAPSGMVHGNQLYRDFEASGYHSYALLMSLVPADDPTVRLKLVSNVNQGLSTSNTYEERVGDYKLLCERVDNRVTMTFGWREWEPTLAAEEPQQEDEVSEEAQQEGETSDPSTEEPATEDSPESETAG